MKKGWGSIEGARDISTETVTGDGGSVI